MILEPLSADLKIIFLLLQSSLAASISPLLVPFVGSTQGRNSAMPHRSAWSLLTLPYWCHRAKNIDGSTLAGALRGNLGWFIFIKEEGKNILTTVQTQ